MTTDGSAAAAPASTPAAAPASTAPISSTKDLVGEVAVKILSALQRVWNKGRLSRHSRHPDFQISIQPDIQSLIHPPPPGLLLEQCMEETICKTGSFLSRSTYHFPSSSTFLTKPPTTQQVTCTGHPQMSPNQASGYRGLWWAVNMTTKHWPLSGLCLPFV